MRIPVFLLVLLAAVTALAQVDTGLVRYRPGFDFAEGIYLRFAAFRANAPELPLDTLKDEQGKSLADLMGGGAQVFVADSAGALVRVDLDSAWGACSNNTVYIRAGDGLFRVGMMGSLCHVLYERSYRDWNTMGYYGTMMGGPVTRTVQEQAVLDMETGKLVPLTGAGLEPLMKRDEVLYEEWNTVPPKRRKDEVLFQFLRRYNDRHPLYFPARR